DAQEARTALFSLVVKSGSWTTSSGARKARAGWRRQSRLKSFRVSVWVIATSFAKRHGYDHAGRPPALATGPPWRLSADRFRSDSRTVKSPGRGGADAEIG